MKTDSSKLWNEKASTYSAMSTSKEKDCYEYEINFPSVLKLCPSNANEVLDMGCGDGVFSIILKEKYLTVDGADVSPNMVEIAKKLHPDLTFFTQDLEEPFQINKEYDLVVYKLVLMFVEDLDNVAKETYKIIRNGGSVVISVHHPTYWFAYYMENKYGIRSRKGFDVLKEGYFTEKQIIKPIGGDKELIFGFIHRTLRTYINTFTKVGFLLKEIDEPRITSAFADRYENFKDKIDIPMRLNLKFIKP